MAAALQVQHNEEEAKVTPTVLVKKSDADVPIVSNTPKAPKRAKRIVNKGPILLYVLLCLFLSR